MRQSQPFASQPVGISSFPFPKRRESYRVVTVRATFTAGAAGGGQQMSLSLSDGANNGIATWSTPPLNVGLGAQFTVTYSSADVDSGLWTPTFGLVTGQIGNVSIPADLWIQPQWTLALIINPNDAADRIATIMLQTESYETRKPVAKVPAQPQAS